MKAALHQGDCYSFSHDRFVDLNQVRVEQLHGCQYGRDVLVHFCRSCGRQDRKSSTHLDEWQRKAILESDMC